MCVVLRELSLPRAVKISEISRLRKYTWNGDVRDHRRDAYVFTLMAQFCTCFIVSEQAVYSE